MIIVNESPIGGASTLHEWLVVVVVLGADRLAGWSTGVISDASRMRHSLQTAKCPFLQADIKYLLDIRPI